MKEKRKLLKCSIIISILLIIALIIWLVIVPMISNNNATKENETDKLGKVDDWEYDPQKIEYESSGGFSNASKGVNFGVVSESMDMSTSVDSASTMGFSVGGAKDIENFRENIENGYFPISTDITYNGLFYDYYFDTKSKTEEKSNELFSPSYSTAISKDPISNQSEYYMTVGLNSNIKESDFTRKKLNLVVVLDISGSMGSSFNSYYYDGNENKDETNKSKMQIANESVNILLDQLNDDDKFGMVLFDDQAYLSKPLNLVSRTDIDAIKNHILEIKARGGTNFEAGYTGANKLMEGLENVDPEEYENRIIVITDAMPNIGRTSKEDLFTMVNDNSKKGIYTTFIGVGVDFNTEVIEKISDTRGANYYSVHNSSEFKERMGEQFEYMVTPLVFDLNLKLNSTDYEIEKVYGSDTANTETSELMKVNTLFPSKSSSNGEVKGGVVLLKLKKLNSNESGTLKLEVSYQNRDGKQFENEKEVVFNGNDNEFYENTGIRKAIVLARYVNAIKNWILYERSEDKKFIIVPQYGIIDCDYTPDEIYMILGENERASQKLKVSEEYKEIFQKIKEYINKENEELKDDTFEKENKVLDVLINS